MAYIQPDSNLYLLKGVPLNPSYDDTFTFSDKQKQYDYFITFNYMYLDRYSVIREKNGVLRVEGSVEDFYGVNYMIFQNGNFGGKWFYAFVTSVEYVNPNTTFLNFTLDVMQTWMFDYEIMPSLIEREHVKDDSLYRNLIPENFSVNERIPFSKPYNLNEYIGEKILVLGFTENPFNYIYELYDVPYDPTTQAPGDSSIVGYSITEISVNGITYNYDTKAFEFDKDIISDIDSITEFKFRLFVEKKTMPVTNIYRITANKEETGWLFTGIEL